jgi:transposase
MKFVPSLEPAAQQQLEQLMKTSPHHRVRQRAHAILLSARGYSIDALADIFSLHRNTISEWISLWQSDQWTSLYDAPKSGRPTKLTAADEQILIEAIENNPRRISDALATLKKRPARS